MLQIQIKKKRMMRKVKLGSSVGIINFFFLERINCVEQIIFKRMDLYR